MVEVTLEEIAHNLVAYLHRAQAGESFVVIQAGTPIAQINPTSALPKSTIAAAISTFRATMDAEHLEVDPDEIWGDVRDRTPAPDQPRW